MPSELGSLRMLEVPYTARSDNLGLYLPLPQLVGHDFLQQCHSHCLPLTCPSPKGTYQVHSFAVPKLGSEMSALPLELRPLPCLQVSTCLRLQCIAACQGPNFNVVFPLLCLKSLLLVGFCVWYQLDSRAELCAVLGQPDMFVKASNSSFWTLLFYQQKVEFKGGLPKSQMKSPCLGPFLPSLLPALTAPAVTFISLLFPTKASGVSPNE